MNFVNLRLFVCPYSQKKKQPKNQGISRHKVKCELCQVFVLFSGNFAEFKCPAEGIPTPTIEWLRNGKPYKSRFMGSVSIKFSNLNQRVVPWVSL